MNDCIEKFARECGAWNQVYGNRTFMIDEHFDIEKFAELIVKECAWLVDENDISLPYGTFGKLIKQHFGVEQ